MVRARERYSLGEADFTQLDCYAIVAGFALKISKWQALGHRCIHCVQVTLVRVLNEGEREGGRGRRGEREGVREMGGGSKGRGGGKERGEIINIGDCIYIHCSTATL